MKLSPQTEILRNAISVFFTLVNVNVKPDIALALLKYFVSKTFAVDKVKFFYAANSAMHKLFYTFFHSDITFQN